jgi:hypothetical protein
MATEDSSVRRRQFARPGRSRQGAELLILLRILIFAFGGCLNDAALARGVFSRRRRSGADDLRLRVSLDASSAVDLPPREARCLRVVRCPAAESERKRH